MNISYCKKCIQMTNHKNGKCLKCDKSMIKNEKDIYSAGVYQGMYLLANAMSGSAGTMAGSMISTAYYLFLKEQEKLDNNNK